MRRRRRSDASSTAASLHAGSTTCDPALDHSAYWFPTLSDGGAALTPDRATFYYTAETTDPRLVQTIPDGLMMIAGDATLGSRQPGPLFR